MATQVVCDSCDQVIDTTQPYYQAVVTKVKRREEDNLIEVVEAAVTLDYHVEHLPVSTPPAAPSVSSLNPAGATAGDADTSVHVFGTNFAEGAVATFDGVDQATTRYDDSHVTFVLAQANIAAAGAFDITVRNKDDQESNRLQFTVTAA